MKSDKKKWSDKDMDEILTTFFRAEVPARLDGPLRLSQSRVAQPSRVLPSAGRTSSSWMNLAVVGCVAALLLAAVMAFQFGGPSDSGRGGLVVEPGEPDEEPINVGDTDPDESDIAVPEQGIELVD